MGQKVVLDTNVFVSGLGWKGASHNVLNECINENLDLFLSVEIFDEIKRVLNYPKFKFSETEINEFLDQILEVGSLVETEIKVDIIKDDPSDNKFLECAITVDADYIISRDPHVLKIDEFRGIKIITPEDYMENR